MSTSAEAALERLVQPFSSDTQIDRRTLAGLLVQLARSVEPGLDSALGGVDPVDPRLEQLRTLLVGREIEVLSRLRQTVEDPEQMAMAVGRALPTAIALGSSDARLGQVLAPALEKAAQSSIRKDSRTLVNILHPLIVPAIRKSIGETIDETFQGLNETLKHSLSWHGLRWRSEAWRTGTSFAKVVLKHTLIYQVEHVFLIHRHTGLLIAHVTAKDAAGQDPQLVSSMLVAIQDFVRDSFSGAENQGLDTARVGELLLWSEPGPFATLAAVIRGNPPEGLHETLRSVLSQIHEERPHALEDFDGDSSGFADVEARLREIAALGQRASRPAERGFPWFIAAIGLVLLAFAGVGGLRWWQHERAFEREQQRKEAEQRLWDGYLAQLRSQPGIVITETGRSGGKFVIAGLRDPLAVNPELMLRQAGIGRGSVVERWQPYQSLDPILVLKRLEASLNPPPGVKFAVKGNRIVAQGSAAFAWILQARAAARMLPAGGPSLDVSRVHDVNEQAFAKLRKVIHSQQIYFATDQSLPERGQEAVLARLAGELHQLASLTSAMRVSARVTVTGYSDDTGNGTYNLEISLARAEAVVVLLEKHGVDPNLFRMRGVGPLEPLAAASAETARSANRRVSFKVHIEGQR